MLPLRILTTLKNLKLDDLMIPVLSPLWAERSDAESNSYFCRKWAFLSHLTFPCPMLPSSISECFFVNWIDQYDFKLDWTFVLKGFKFIIWTFFSDHCMQSISNVIVAPAKSKISFLFLPHRPIYLSISMQNYILRCSSSATKK